MFGGVGVGIIVLVMMILTGTTTFFPQIVVFASGLWVYFVDGSRLSCWY